MIRTLTSLLLILNILVCSGQNSIEHRKAQTIEIVLDSITSIDIPVEISPYFVEPKVLLIYPSDTLNIEIEIAKDTIASMKVVDKILFPEKTVTLEFTQTVHEDFTTQMTLDMYNPFDKKLSYKAYMVTPYSEGWVETSIIPVFPKIHSVELWGDTIISLILEEWKLIKM
ncbi:hypothetical protein [Patiriisocius marinus]|uniref:hypothetical protein n=1 Tax=Patiriisocius marinus TaxID=1397112 RepID=UPI00124EF53E|nr:hypothetical protein [Patiriisocius marinus]